MLSPKLVARWMNRIRETQGYPKLQYELTECFWESQLISKAAIVDVLKALYEPPSYIVIYGGWFGLLAQMIREEFPRCGITSVDIREECTNEARTLLGDDNETIVPITADMAKFRPYLTPDWVINTCTEHVNQETYDEWFVKIDPRSHILIQGNNLQHPDHIRCSVDMVTFLAENRFPPYVAPGPVRTLEIPCPGNFTRFMAWK